MLVRQKDYDDDAYASTHFGDGAAPCFFCGEPLSKPFIIWRGGRVGLVLHPRCAVELIVRLMRDIHEFECTEHKRVEYIDYPPRRFL